MVLFRNATWALKGNFLYAVSQWALLIVLAKLGGSEVVGRYTLGLAITAPIILLTGLQLRSLVATDVREEGRFRDYVRLRLLLSIIALAVVGGIVFSFNFTAGQAVVILLVGLAKILESGSDIFYGVMQKHERMDAIALSKIMRGIATVFVCWVTLSVTESLVAGLVSIVLVWALVLVLVDYPKACHLGAVSFKGMSEVFSRDGWTKARLLPLVWHALPLGVVSMLISYNNAVPRYLLESYHGEKALGYFAAIAYFSSVITITVEALGQAVLPRLAKYYEGEPPQYWRLLGRLSVAALVLGLLGVVGALAIGTDLLRLVYKPEFSMYGGLLVLVMVLGAFESLCSAVGVGLTAARVLRFQVPVQLVVVMATTSAGLRFIPEYGLAGAAWASILGMVIWAGTYGLIIGNLRHQSTRRPLAA